MKKNVVVEEISNGFLVTVESYHQYETDLAYNDTTYTPPTKTFAPNTAELGNVIANAFAS